MKPIRRSDIFILFYSLSFCDISTAFSSLPQSATSIIFIMVMTVRGFIMDIPCGSVPHGCTPRGVATGETHEPSYDCRLRKTAEGIENITEEMSTDCEK